MINCEQSNNNTISQTYNSKQLHTFREKNRSSTHSHFTVHFCFDKDFIFGSKINLTTKCCRNQHFILRHLIHSEIVTNNPNLLNEYLWMSISTSLESCNLIRIHDDFFYLILKRRKNWKVQIYLWFLQWSPIPKDSIQCSNVVAIDIRNILHLLSEEQRDLFLLSETIRVPMETLPKFVQCLPKKEHNSKVKLRATQHKTHNKNGSSIQFQTFVIL